jgi:hypothetical protein
LPFVLPIRSGAVPPDSAELPEYLRRAHWLDGVDTPEGLTAIVHRVKALYREYQLSLVGAT